MMALWQSARALSDRALRAPLVDHGRIRINERWMTTGRIYEIQTSQGPMQFVKGEDGIVTVYEIYDLGQDWDAPGT